MPPGLDSHFSPNQASDLPADVVLRRLRALRLRVHGSGPWQACCPAHRDRTPSLSLTETREGVLLLHCFAGCDTEDILEKLGLTCSDLYPSLYALQFSKRRPQGPVSYRGGDAMDGLPVDDPNDEECREWKRTLKSWPLPDYALNQLAVQLDLPREALLPLKVGYNLEDDHGPCWIFPERDDRRRIVGLLRRYGNGCKWSMTWSTRGLALPSHGKKLPSGPIYLVEGASDTAALLSVQAFVFGRSSAEGHPAERLWLTRLLRQHPEREIIVVGERDSSGAGTRGASRMAAYLHEALKRSVAWALPRKRYKDSREQVVAGKWHLGLSIQEVLQ